MIFFVDAEVPIGAALARGAAYSARPDDDFVVMSPVEILGVVERRELESVIEQALASLEDEIGTLQLRPVASGATEAGDEIFVSSPNHVVVAGQDAIEMVEPARYDAARYSAAFDTRSLELLVDIAWRRGIFPKPTHPVRIRRCGPCQDFFSLPPSPPNGCQHRDACSLRR
jgi:hypothetical protein